MTHRWQCLPQLKTQTSVYQGGFEKHISDPTQAHVLLGHGNDRKLPVYRSVSRVSIVSKTENMCHTYQLNVMHNNSVPIIVIFRSR